VLVGDDHQRFEVAQILVGSPVLRELDRGAHQLPVILLELAFKPLEQRESVGGRAGEAADDITLLADAADFLRIGLHHRIAHRHLAVAGNDCLAALLNAKDRGSVPTSQSLLLSKLRWEAAARLASSLSR